VKTRLLIFASLAVTSVARADDPEAIATREKLPRSHPTTQVSNPAPVREELGMDVSDVKAEPAPAPAKEPSLSAGIPVPEEEFAPPTTVVEVVASKPAPAPEAEPAKALPEHLDAEDVMAEVVMHRPELAQCVAALHNDAPQLSGTLVMRWTIHPRGATTDITAENADLEVAALADCIRDEIRGWVFPEHGGAQRVQFEFKY
jgi:hypothetical protein